MTEPVAIEVLPIENYYSAEEYHQEYLIKNPAGYCHIKTNMFEVDKTAVDKATVERSTEKRNLQKKLTPMQFEVTQNGATEPCFQNEYYDLFEAGIYVDVTSGEPLFVSTDKFEPGCGWPSFSKPISKALLVEIEGLSFGRKRVEVRSQGSDAHLGHVFEDGPAELGGLRYCMNSAFLRFAHKDDMEKEGYGNLLPLLSEK